MVFNLNHILNINGIYGGLLKLEGKKYNNIGEIMKARIWWWLRDRWHRPNFWKHSPKSKPFYHLDELYRNMKYFYYVNKDKTWLWFVYRKVPKYLWRVLVAIWWKFLAWQPFSCKGNGKHWQTRFCEWLEDNARKEEL